MWTTLTAQLGAFIARLTPDTPPAAWLPFAGYAGETVAALIVAGTARVFGASRLAAILAAAAWLAVHRDPGTPGILVIALTLLGLLSVRRWTVSGWLFVTVLLISVTTRTWLLLWVVFAFGLDEVVRFIGTAGRRRAAGSACVLVLFLIVITAQLPARATSTPPPPAPLGHDRVTLTSLRALISNIPSGSALVDDGPVTNILMRAMAADLDRAHVEIARLPNDPAVVRDALTRRRVFALPHAQQSLQLRGFRIVDGLRTADRGLAEVQAGGECATATDAWQPAPSLAARTDLAFVADNAERRGPIALYLVGDAPIRIDAVNWPPRTLRGFSPHTFDLTKATERQALDQERADDNGPGDARLAATPSATRVALWRMPDAALAMPIRLSAPATLAYLKLSPEATGAVSVCPVFPSSVQPIR